MGAEMGAPAENRKGDGKKLPFELAAKLAPEARKALDHPVRREILRGLNGSGESRSPAELAKAALSGADISSVSYHARVLEVCGSVRSTGTHRRGGNQTRLYASNVAGDGQIALVLQATWRLDRDEE